MGLNPGKLIAYTRRQGSKAFTGKQGAGADGSVLQGKADAGATHYQERVNDVTQSRLTGFIKRAAAALSVNKSELIIQDEAGHQMLGESHEQGTNVADSVPRTF